MHRRRVVGATAAAMLPAALSAAVLVSAPFAGTTTAPLADSQSAGTHGAAQRPAGLQPAVRPPAVRPPANLPRDNGGIGFSLSTGDLAALAGFELCLLGVGAGVIVAAARRRADAEA